MELPKVSMDTVRPCVRSCLTGLTTEQWGLLEAGTPDDATRLRLADMLLNVLRCVMDVLSDYLRKGVTMERVRSSLSDSITRCFAEAVGVEMVKGPGPDTMMDWIVTEVVNRASSEKPVQPKPTNSVIRSVCRMLKKFAGKMCRCHKKQSRHSSVQTSSFQAQAKRFIDSESSMTQSVQSVLSVKMNVIIEPIVEDVENIEYNQLQEQFSRETQTAAEDIAQSFSEYISSKDGGSVRSSPKTQQQKNLKGVRAKICNFFARIFAKASICRIFSQVKSKFHGEAKVSDGEEVKSLLADVEPVLQTREDALDLIHRLQNLSRDDMLELTGDLSDLLYSHITGDCVPESFREGLPGTAGSDHHPSAHIYNDIRNRVVCFLSLTSWWLENQVSRYSDKVLLALMENETTAQVPQVTVGAEPRQEEATGGTAQDETEQTSIKLLITTLIKKVRKSVRGDKSFFTDVEATVRRLVDKTCAELDGTNVKITPRNAESLVKAIFKDLRKKWGSALGVLVSIETGDKKLPQCIAASCKTHAQKAQPH
uniref:uncharacterized protein LOC122771960 n=1 Tax=Solea senegalensis TaxID=28829 RepID=UPI001CD889AD|nr:uncharacterized protein LOC122771960 [Solea senegalensis]XP_043885505.1 uncharacterized protein LOC122771960 [Solea senegalensis]